MIKKYTCIHSALLGFGLSVFGQVSPGLSESSLNRSENGTNSALSRIIDNTNYSTSAPEFNSRPEYINFIDSSPTSAGKFIPMKIKILDGPDEDEQGTTLTGLRLTVKDLSNTNQIDMIKTAILTGVGGTVIATAAKTENELVFSGMSGPLVTADDDDSKGKILHIRVSFDETKVVDKTKLIFKITSATADPAGSIFSAMDAGGAESDTGNNNRNRLNVTADRLQFTTQPSETSVGFSMSPYPIVSLTDLYGNIDLDVNMETIDITSTGVPNIQPSSTIANGRALLTNIEHSNPGGPYFLTASNSGWSATSDAFNISDTAINTYRTTGSGPWMNNTASPAIWERYNGLTWDAANSPNYDSSHTVFIRSGHAINSNDAFENNMTLNVFNDGTFNVNHNGSLRNLIIHSGGRVNINDHLSIKPSGTLVVRDDGNLTINYKYDNPSNSLWSGIENFYPASNIIIKNWNESHILLPNNTVISANTHDEYTAVFGNILFDFETNSTTQNFDFLASGVHLNLAHSNLIFRSNTNSNGAIRLSTSGTVISGIGGDFHVEDTFTQPQNIIFKTSGILDFTIKGDMILDAGTIIITDGAGSSSNITVEGNLNINADAIVDFKSTLATDTTATLNLFGDLKVSQSGLLQNSYASENGILNFIGTGNELPNNGIQSIDIASNHPDENRHLNFNIKNHAVVQLINRDFELGRKSELTVETGGTLDFGFIDTTALNVAISGSQTGMHFITQQGSSLKITSPNGISNTANLGNVRTVPSHRDFSQYANFYYIGKEHQETGNGLTTGSTAKNVIVNLENDLLEFRLTNRTGISEDGRLEINRGIVIGEKVGNEDRDFYGPRGQLIMTGGEYRISVITTNPLSDYLPQLRNYSSYSLTGGSIHLNGTNAIQILSGIPLYKNLIFSGINDFSRASELYNFKGISKATGITDRVTISENAILDVQNKTFGGATTRLIMTDNARYVTAGTGTKPDANGSYEFGADTTIEFNNNGGLEEIRISNPVPSYANIIVSGSNVGTESLGSGPNSFIQFQPNGTFTVTETGVFKIKNHYGFSDANNTAIANTNSPNIILEDHSTIEYAGTDQSISLFVPEYKNLTISGNGIKTLDNSNHILIGQNLNVNSGTLLIGTAESLTVAESVNVHPSAHFNLEDSASLIQIDDTSINNGKITMIRKASIKHQDYVYWSSPITGYNVSAISPTNHIYRWDPIAPNPNQTQGNWIEATNEIMIPGKGYIVRAPHNHPAPNGPDDLNFTTTFYSEGYGLGVPNNGVISIEIERGSNAVSAHHTDDNWNLIGNPYPSAISAIEFLNYNPFIDGYVNLWKHGLPLNSSTSPFYQDFKLNYHQADYFSYNKTGDSDGPSAFSGYIAAGQSFMVSMIDGPNAASANVVFKNSMRNRGYDNSHFFRTPLISSEEKHRLWLDLISPTMPTNRILVGYVDGATMGKDRLFDAKINFDNSTEGIYTLIDAEGFIIQGRSLPFNDTDIIRLGLKVTKEENYIIAISAADGLFENGNQVVYLKDHLLDFVHNLSYQPYSFNSEAGTFNNRFEIIFQNQALSLHDKDLNSKQVSIIELSNGHLQFSIKDNLSINSVEIIDLLGRSLYNLKGQNATEIYDVSNLPKATYIAKVTLSNGQVISKRFVKKH